ncbi:MAG: hypothetical protein KG003_09460 [Bacteroidetes bacterium]|nr:hypothetical protein [Bacteroidota bacterium]
MSDSSHQFLQKEMLWHIREVSKTSSDEIYQIQAQQSLNGYYESLTGKWMKFHNDSVSIFCDLEETVMFITFEEGGDKVGFTQIIIPDSIYFGLEKYESDSSNLNQNGNDCLFYYADPLYTIDGNIRTGNWRQYCLKEIKYLPQGSEKKLTDFFVMENGKIILNNEFNSYQLIIQRF